MSDEQANPKSGGRDELPNDEAAIIAALERARQASAEGRVYSLEEAKQKAAQWTVPDR
jgi:hypothetical protein